MSLFKQFEMDADKEEKGVAVTYAPNDDKTVPTFYIRRRTSSNQMYAKTLTNESKPYRHLLRLGVLDDRTSEAIMLRTFCKTLLIGWDYVYNKQNEPIPYSVENAISLMQQLPDLYLDLQAQSDNIALFRAETMEGDAKN